jgi:hypothetical protein
MPQMPESRRQVPDWLLRFPGSRELKFSMDTAVVITGFYWKNTCQATSHGAFAGKDKI